jgi:8-oxo-dGTP pyrophosphatase MutT (NUDIX family)
MQHISFTEIVAEPLSPAESAGSNTFISSTEPIGRPLGEFKVKIKHQQPVEHTGYTKHTPAVSPPFAPCKTSLTSFGVVAFRIHPDTHTPEYLMICRKHTLGYMDFIRGKMPLTHKKYLLQMFNQMTISEKESLRVLAQTPHVCRKEKIAEIMRGVSIKSGETYNTISLVEESNQYGYWDEPEWGFPKGKRNSHESIYACALREFNEETGFPVDQFHSISTKCNVEETFMGSNLKTYCHRYMVMFIPYEQSTTLNMQGFQTSEVSNMRWMSYEKCMETIRGYNMEKKQMLTRLHIELGQNLNSKLFNRYMGEHKRKCMV